MNKKYEFIDETKTIDGHLLHRIRRLSDGVIGGWIESEDNLSQEGNCWVADDAKVFGNAQVSGDASISGRAKVFSNAKVSDKAAKVFGNAKVSGDASISERAKVYGDAKVYDDADVSWNAQVYGDAKVYGAAKVHGWARVYDNAKVHGNADIGGEARVYGYAIVEDNACINYDACIYGNATIKDCAHIYGRAGIGGSAKLYGHAKVYDNACVDDNVKVYDNAQICGNARVSGNACVYNNAKVYGLARVYDNARVSGNACVYDNAKVCGDTVVRDFVLNDDMKIDGNNVMEHPVEPIPERVEYYVYHTSTSSEPFTTSWTKQDLLEYLANTIKNETDDGYFEYKTWEKTAAHCDPALSLRVRSIMVDGTPAMGLIIYNSGYDEKVGYYDEEITLNFVNEKELPVTWHDVEMFMKDRDLKRKTITDIPEPVESCEDGMSADNTKEYGE